jgi:hypothetical protein
VALPASRNVAGGPRVCLLRGTDAGTRLYPFADICSTSIVVRIRQL